MLQSTSPFTYSLAQDAGRWGQHTANLLRNDFRLVLKMARCLNKIRQETTGKRNGNELRAIRQVKLKWCHKMNRVRNGQNCYPQVISCCSVRQTHRWHGEEVKHIYELYFRTVWARNTHRSTDDGICKILQIIFLRSLIFVNRNVTPSTAHVTITTGPLILTNDLRSL
jgi:hypothetical protein